MNKLDICKKTRAIAADALYEALKKLLTDNKPISEALLRDTWLKNIRKKKSVFPDGWYTPPPHGIEVLFGSERNFSRINVESVRPEKFWPRDNVFLNKQTGIMSLYAGLVDRQTGIIGDIGMTVYLGKNRKIINHLQRTLRITIQIAEYANIGMTLKKISDFGNTLMEKENLYNGLLSTTDPAGINMGHTIPFSYENMSINESKLFSKAETNWTNFKDMISRKRRFVSGKDELFITPGFALTMEPRPRVRQDDAIPMAWFHTTVLFHEDDRKELLTNFDKIFMVTGMNYMLSQ